MRYSTVGWDLGNLQLLIPAYSLCVVSLSCVGGVNRRIKEYLAVTVKVHAFRIDVNIETTMTSEIQDREEIGAKLRDM